MLQESGEKETPYFHLSTLAKGLRIIEILSEEGNLSAAELGRRLGIDRTSSRRYLSTLLREGYLRKDDNSRYRLSYKIFELGTKAANLYSLRDDAYPLMRGIAWRFNKTVNFGCLQGEDVVYLEKAESSEILRIDCRIGSRAPAYCTALGKAILAFLPLEELERYLQKTPLRAYTAGTITNREDLIKELQLVREEGVAVDKEELVVGLRCLGAPVFDRHGYPRYAISVCDIAARMGHDQVEELKKEIRAVCQLVSSRLIQEPSGS